MSLLIRVWSASRQCCNLEACSENSGLITHKAPAMPNASRPKLISSLEIELYLVLEQPDSQDSNKVFISQDIRMVKEKKRWTKAAMGYFLFPQCRKPSGLVSGLGFTHSLLRDIISDSTTKFSTKFYLRRPKVFSGIFEPSIMYVPGILRDDLIIFQNTRQYRGRGKLHRLRNSVDHCWALLRLVDCLKISSTSE